MVEARRIINEKLRENRYREGYTRSLEEREQNEMEIIMYSICGQVKRAMVESARELCGSMRVGVKNTKSVWWNNKVKAAVRRKESAWMEVLVAGDEDSKQRCMEAYREAK